VFTNSTTAQATCLCSYSATQARMQQAHLSIPACVKRR
jgi:hypothetical protein